MIISDIDMIAQDMVCIAERADGNGKVEGYYFSLHHNDGRTHLHHLIIPLEADLSRGTPLDKIQIEVVPESITLKAQESSVPSVTAVPLDKLCEWLSDNAYMYLTEKELDSGYSSHDPAYWEMKLSKWMEEQDAR